MAKKQRKQSKGSKKGLRSMIQRMVDKALRRSGQKRKRRAGK